MKIGQFTKSDNGYIGEVCALGIRVKGLFIRPVATKPNEKGPDFAVTMEVVDMTTEVGAAWKKTSRDGKPYLSIRIDGPTIPAPINCALVHNAQRGLDLMWTRDSRKEDASV